MGFAGESGESAAMKGRITVRGTARFCPRTSLSGATAFIRVRDVSFADAPASAVAEQVIERLSGEAGRDMIVPFELSFQPVEGRHYGLEAHVSAAARREIEVGDYLTMESYPVSTTHDVTAIVVELLPVDRFRLHAKGIRNTLCHVSIFGGGNVRRKQQSK